MLHNSKTFTLKPLLAALAFAPGLVIADNQLSQIVVTANQIEQPLANVTADVTIITAEDLRAQRATSLIEVLNTVPGLSFTQNGPVGTTTTLYMRGSDNQRTLILIDGVRVQDPSNTAGANLADLMVANIERIEIIKGAQSGVWGSDAAAGVINIITKQSLDTTINVEHGAYNTGRTALSTGLKMADARVFLNASHLSSEGFTAQAPVGERNLNKFENDGYRNTNLSARVIAPIAENQTLTFAHNHTQARAEYDGFDQITYQPLPNAEKRSVTQTNLSQIIYQIGSTKLSAEQSLFVTRQLDEGYRDHVEAKVQSLSLSHQIKNLLIGTSYSINKVDVEKPFYDWSTWSPVYVEQSIQSKTTETKSLFATHTHQWRNFTFNEALRYDNYSNFGSEVTGKLGTKVAVTENQSVAINYGTAYNAPSLLEITNPFGGDPNPDLKPEKSTESSITYQAFDFNITYFNKDINDLISWPNFPNGGYENVKGTTNIKGIEAEYKKRFNQWQFAINYTHLETKKADGKPLALRPDNQVGLNVNWFPTDSLDLNLNGQFIATRGGEVDPVTENYSVWNTVINYDINSTTTTYVKLNNIFDTYYQTVAGFATAPRSAYLGLSVTF